MEEHGESDVIVVEVSQTDTFVECESTLGHIDTEWSLFRGFVLERNC